VLHSAEVDQAGPAVLVDADQDLFQAEGVAAALGVSDLAISDNIIFYILFYIIMC